MKTQQETTEEADFTCLLAEIDTETTTEEEQIDEEQTWDEAGYVDVNIAFPDLSDLPEEGTEDATTAINQAKQFLTRNQDMFASNYNSLGRCNISQHRIETTSETPIFQYAYRKSYRERELMQEEVDKMLAAGVIRPSRSP